ncbi:MAG: DUF3450 family protein, partial [Phycisphaeraceae bacterium]|nr:DUF3450 family protein [Phycisphaeraceae bacterium]
ALQSVGAVMAVLLLVVSARGQTAVTDVQARQLHEQVAELEAVEQAIRQERERYQAQRRELQAQIDRLEAQLEPVEAAAQRRASAVAELEDRVSGLEQDRQANRDYTRKLAGVITPQLKDLKRQVEGGILFRRVARMTDVDRVLSALEEGPEQTTDDRLSAVADGIGRMNEQLSLAGTREIINAPMLLEEGKRRVEAYQVRVGLVALWARGEEGQPAAVSGPGMTGWRVLEDSDRVSAVDKAVAMFRDRQPPAILTVPVPNGSASDQEGSQ